MHVAAEGQDVEKHGGDDAETADVSSHISALVRAWRLLLSGSHCGVDVLSWSFTPKGDWSLVV